MEENYTKPKMVVLLSYPKSGSTVFGELINQLDEFIHVGEIERLWYLEKHKDSSYSLKDCSCGVPLYECDFWGPYYKKMVAKIVSYNKKNNTALSSKDLHKYKEELIKKGIKSGPEINAYTEIVNELYSSLAKNENKIILDSSKELWYAKYLESTGLYDLSYIYLVRDVKGVVYSRQRKLRELNNNSGKLSLDYRYLIYDTLRWNIKNTKMKQFLKNKRHIKVAYEELVQNPHIALQELAKMSRIEIDPTTAINSDNEFTITENHLIHGNRFRYKRGKIKFGITSPWRNEMKTIDKTLINLLTWYKMDEIT